MSRPSWFSPLAPLPWSLLVPPSGVMFSVLPKEEKALNSSRRCCRHTSGTHQSASPIAKDRSAPLSLCSRADSCPLPLTWASIFHSLRCGVPFGVLRFCFWGCDCRWRFRGTLLWFWRGCSASQSFSGWGSWDGLRRGGSSGRGHSTGPAQCSLNYLIVIIKLHYEEGNYLSCAATPSSKPPRSAADKAADPSLSRQT